MRGSGWPPAFGCACRFTLRPWFWLAGLRRTQRIFHNRTAPQIIAEVLADYSDSTSEQRLTGSHEPLEYTVQYRETDLAFVSRMAERFGISEHFDIRCPEPRIRATLPRARPPY